MATGFIDAQEIGNGSGPITLTKQYAAKTLLRYDQTGPTVTSSSNVSSVSDDGAGVFTVSVTSSYSASSEVAPCGISGEHGGGNDALFLSKRFDQSDWTVSAITFASWDVNGTHSDAERNAIAIFGDLT